MAVYEDFKVTGASIVPYQQPFDDKPAVVKGIKNAVMKAVVTVAGFEGTLDQNALAAKFGEPGGSGIVGRTAEYGYEYHNEQHPDTPNVNQITVLVKFTVRANVLQKVLIEEGVLALPVEEETPPAPPRRRRN